MYDQLPKNNKEADERLLTLVTDYVVYDGMPLDTAQRIIKEDSREFDNFEKAWKKFKQMLKQRETGPVK